MVDCTSARTQVLELADDQRKGLTPEVMNHLQDCDECSAVFQEFVAEPIAELLFGVYSRLKNK